MKWHTFVLIGLKLKLKKWLKQGPNIWHKYKHIWRVNVDNLNEEKTKKNKKKIGFHVNHSVEESKSVMIFPYGYIDFNISRFLVRRMRHGFIVYLFNLFQFFSIDSTELRICILYVFVFAIVFFSLLVSSVFFLSDRNKWRVFEFAWIFSTFFFYNEQPYFNYWSQLPIKI